MLFRRTIVIAALAGCLASPGAAQYDMPSPVFTAAIGNGPGMMVWEQGKASDADDAPAPDDAAPSFGALSIAIGGSMTLGTATRAPYSMAALTFAPSDQRRRANLARFVARTRAGNPESAEQMERLFASTDVLGQVQSAVAPYNYSISDVGDAYAFWWMTAWEGARGSNRAFSCGEMQAVQAQARTALASTPAMAGATDAQKQEMAEAMWIHAAMIDGMVDMAKEQPDLMPQLRRAIRQGASASGLDLDAMRLTDEGFVPS